MSALSKPWKKKEVEAERWVPIDFKFAENAMQASAIKKKENKETLV